MSGDDGLLTQAEARREAARLNADPLPGLAAVARPEPAGCWGGTECGWTVDYVATGAPACTVPGCWCPGPHAPAEA